MKLKLILPAVLALALLGGCAVSCPASPPSQPPAQTGGADAAQPDQDAPTFCLVSGDQWPHTGPQGGTYPWGCTGFPETPTFIRAGDRGERLYSFSADFSRIGTCISILFML